MKIKTVKEIHKLAEKVRTSAIKVSECDVFNALYYIYASNVVPTVESVQDFIKFAIEGGGDWNAKS